MNSESGASLACEAPNPENRGLGYASINNSSANLSVCKPPSSTSFGDSEHDRTVAQLSQYLALGLVPIPLRGKRPFVRWKEWDPHSIETLKPYIKTGVNWGVKTGPNLTVIDFDTKEAFLDFIVNNLEKLSEDTPIVKTGRGYHIWLKSIEPIRCQQFEGIDIKGEGGYVVTPPSRHPNGKEYKFIKPLNGHIPEIDLNELDFPRIKPSPSQPVTPHQKVKVKSRKGAWALEKGFDLAELESGVKKGTRHTTLVRYVGWLINQELLYEQVMEEAKSWNARNRPPLSKAEVEATVKSCWGRWGRDVPTITLSSSRVLVETGDSLAETVDYKVGASESNVWSTETVVDPVSFCGLKSRIVRSERRYVSINFFCGRWDCPRCAPFFKKRWIRHLTEIAKGQDLYVLECSEDDWGCVRRSINRLGADYCRIRNKEGNLAVVLDKPHPKSKLLSTNLGEFLEAVIPDSADSCPVSTSRTWERSKNTKKEEEFHAVTETWLSLAEQVQIAMGLGAELSLYEDYCWYSPEGVNQDDWEFDFKDAIESRENEIHNEVDRIVEGDKRRQTALDESMTRNLSIEERCKKYEAEMRKIENDEHALFLAVITRH
jgi:hypothetical protein